MKTLTEQDVFQTGCNSVPKMYADGVVGIGSKLAAAADICAGHTVRFAICDRTPGTAEPPQIRQIITIAMGDGGDPAEGYKPRCARFCGENNDPNGAGSHSLIASYYPYCDDQAAIAVALAQHCAKQSPWVFRLPNLPAPITTVVPIVPKTENDAPRALTDEVVVECIKEGIANANGKHFTPGPWWIRPGKDSRDVYAAPDLLEALEGMMEWARRVKSKNPGMEVANACNAISKAKGGAL